TGRRGDQIKRAGGWGHILGDAGGGYFLSIQALRLILREHDLHRSQMQFSAKVLHALSLNNLDELVRWVQTADKMEIAMLAPVIFEAATESDARMMEIIEEGTRVLCEYTEAVASALHLLAPRVVLIGGLFYRDSIYTHAFRRRLKKNLPDARVAIAERPPELGAAWLAAEVHGHVTFQAKLSENQIDGLAAVLTEQRNPRSENLEKLSPRELVELFIGDERGIKNSDAVIGITASGRTPFVLGALARAKSLGAKTILLTCNPGASAVVAGVSPAEDGTASDAQENVVVDFVIKLAVGPELL